ncbi:hypothetical protein [Nitrosomonas sp.]|uniref:hypothetical protein n=1 Tax=Nitrosomonas sp. TaxID=42353 RepID=UPI0025FB8CE2|nr:hypothetical protein [Nitrosomonas sp.]
MAIPTVASQCFHDTLDGLVKQAPQLFCRRCAYTAEIRRAILDMIGPIDYQAIMVATSFSTYEQLVLNALDKNASKIGVASGHDIRLALQAAGLGKREIGVTMGALVEKGVLERLKVIDADGLFYMAYRRVTLGK